MHESWFRFLFSCVQYNPFIWVHDAFKRSVIGIDRHMVKLHIFGWGYFRDMFSVCYYSYVFIWCFSVWKCANAVYNWCLPTRYWVVARERVLPVHTYTHIIHMSYIRNDIICIIYIFAYMLITKLSSKIHALPLHTHSNITWP